MEEERKKYYRFAPCPSYDIEGMEGWLEAMADQGYFLDEAGFWGGIGVFIRKSPGSVRYRLEPKDVSRGTVNDSMIPDDDVQAFYQDYGWMFVADRGKYYIYRNEQDGARELNTEPEIQALALEPMYKAEKQKLILSIYWIILYPALLSLLGQASPLRMFLDIGCGLSFWGAFLGIWQICRSGARLWYIKRLRRRLKAGEMPERGSQRRRNAAPYVAGNVLFAVLLTGWIICLVNVWSYETDSKGRIALQNYDGQLPFAVLTDLASEKGGTFTELPRYGPPSNYITEHSDLLAPVVIHMNQRGTIGLDDGTELEGNLYIDYYETSAPWIARLLAREYLREARRESHYEELALPELSVDYGIGYRTYFPMVLLCKGRIMIRAELIQSPADSAIPYETWVRVLADSLQFYPSSVTVRAASTNGSISSGESVGH